MTTLSRICFSTKVSLCLLAPSMVMGYKHIDPVKFAYEKSPEILRNLGANESLLKVHKVSSNIMADILKSDMVQRMANNTLPKEEWDQKYMRADVLYIYNLGKALDKRAQREQTQDRTNMNELIEMFLGYQKHFERLKRYGLSSNDTLISSECDEHINFLTENTSIDEYYVAILTDMIPYVVFANYLLNVIEESDNNSWLEYAKKYGDLNNKYAKEKLGKAVRIANEILLKRKIENARAEHLFLKGFTFEEWFIRNAFSKGFDTKKQ